jgi:hypothetical protein
MFKDVLDDVPEVYRSAIPKNLVSWKDLYTCIETRMDMMIKMIDPEDGIAKEFYRDEVEFIMSQINSGNSFIIHNYRYKDENTLNFVRSIQKKYNVVCDLHVYAGLEKKNFNSFKKHVDPSANFICQFDGVSNWKVYDKQTDNTVIDTKLFPGDVLYIPFETYHLAEPEGKRISVSVAMWKK